MKKALFIDRDGTVIADQNYVERVLRQPVTNTDLLSYVYGDRPITGYSYHRIIPDTITLPNGMVIAVPGAGTTSSYMGRIAADGSLGLGL